MTIQDKLVSIVVPVYNAEAYLDDNINSILGQTYRNIQVILVDDGSKDNSATICKAFCESDSRVVYHYKNNGGVSSARNCGIEIASGDYVMFVDSDDTVKPYCVERLVEALETTQSDLCICGYDVLTVDSEVQIPAPADRISGKEPIAKYFANHFLKGVTSSVWGKLYKKDLISEGFQTDFTMAEDLLFNLRYFQNIGSCCVISDCLYQYNQVNPYSLMKNYKKVYFSQNKAVYLSWLNWLDELQLDKAFKTNVYKRISEALINYIVFVVMQDCGNERVNAIRKTYDDIMRNAVQCSVGSFPIHQKIMLKLYEKKHYTALVCYVKVYLLSKKIMIWYKPMMLRSFYDFLF